MKNFNFKDFKNLKKEHKLLIGATGIVALALTGVVAFNVFQPEPVTTAGITSDVIEGLIDESYSVTGLEQSKDKTIILTEGLDTKGLESLAKKYAQLHADANLSGSVNIYQFEIDKTPSDIDSIEIFDEGIQGRAVIDMDEQAIALTEKTIAPTVSAADTAIEFETGTTNTSNATVKVEFNMAFDGTETYEDVVAQAKLFTELFRTANPSAQIENIHLIIHGTTKTYEFKTGFNDYLGVTTVTPL